MPQPNYAYSVLRNTPSGELVEQDESVAKRGRENVPRRYICDECGTRFDRPSTLEVRFTVLFWFCISLMSGYSSADA